MPSADAMFDEAFARINQPSASQEPPLSVWQKLGKTWPAQMAQSALNAVALPGQVASGQLETKPTTPGMWSDEDEARQQATQGTMMNRAADLAGVVMGGSYAAPAMKDATGMGIRAYHGSPHDFDRFDLSKIGTGEGAQAYGHGLYFAEKEGVAKSYRDAITGTTGPDNVAARMTAGGQSPSLIEQRLRQLYPSIGDAEIAKAFEFAKNKPGRMYEVDIKANPEQFLDWDKPLAQMSESVRGPVSEFLQKSPPQHPIIGRLDYDPSKTGAQVYSELEHTGASKAGSAAALRELGIPGIKYLDQGSRGAGDGSRNYVVFDDRLVDILRKYGVAGGGALAAMGYGADKAEAKQEDFGAKMQAELQSILAP